MILYIIKHTERTLQPTRHGEEEEAAVADTEALTDPLPADHHLTFSSSSSSPSITPPLLLRPHLPACLPSLCPLSPPARPPQYRLSSWCNPHLQAAAEQRASLVNVSKVRLDCRRHSLMHTHVLLPVCVCVCVRVWFRTGLKLHTNCPKSCCVKRSLLIMGGALCENLAFNLAARGRAHRGQPLNMHG